MKRAVYILIIASISLALGFGLNFVVNGGNHAPAFGIQLTFGWTDCFGHSGTGFPFHTQSIPPIGYLCAIGENSLAEILNLLFYSLLVFIPTIIIFKNKFKRA